MEKMAKEAQEKRKIKELEEEKKKNAESIKK